MELRNRVWGCPCPDYLDLGHIWRDRERLLG